METRILGKTSLDVSVVGLGGIPIQGLSFDDSALVLHKALDCGITFIDTARGYTDSEEKIGRALSSRRSEFILASKALSRDAAGMAKEIETSLRDLQTDFIDIYQLHAIGSDKELAQVLAPGGAYEALARAREQGKVGFLGITSHSRPALIAAIQTGAFDTVQHPFNPIEIEWSDDVIPAATEAGVGIIAMKPAAGGALTHVPAALRFELTRGIDVVIPGMDSIAQVEENAAVGERLRPPNHAELLALACEKERWGGRFCRRCGYCMPCPNGLHIPMLLLLHAYYERYDLIDWALERLAGLEKKYSDCTACGECLEKCPYHLPIPDLMARGAEQVRR
ncbi:MAG: aldo/keto reductase [Candidatus Eisenbacteria sp.]|nr:aldo/keto reductase [Candidatus Eisenbacteria bacterium]